MSYLIYMKQALANLFKKPVTSSYPLQPKVFAKGDRGHVENDASKCILCGMCMRSCPAGAIEVDRKAGTWKINPFSCVQCSACVENCPKKCLSMLPEYTAPATEKKEIVLQVAALQSGVSGTGKPAASAKVPASGRPRNQIVNDVSRCICCGMCQRNCPAGAITVDNARRTWRIDLEACVNCDTCITNCPRKCLRLGSYPEGYKEVVLQVPMPAAPGSAAGPEEDHDA
ncbi:MAG: 4Fe-4S dicluster domain-containing protein [Succiniclasticum sp.]|jgi:formate hydrogenlyase subunit 6/NADH:ubiquinone oxidoreductase subunit I